MVFDLQELRRNTIENDEPAQVPLTQGPTLRASFSKQDFGLNGLLLTTIAPAIQHRLHRSFLRWKGNEFSLITD